MRIDSVRILEDREVEGIGEEFESRISHSIIYIGALEKDKILGTLAFENLLWDSSHFGFKMGKINKIVTIPGEYGTGLKIKNEMLKYLDKYCIDNNICFVNCRLDISDISSIHSLEADGFLFVDVLTTFFFDFKKSNIRNDLNFDARIRIRPWRENDLNELSSIAGNIYSYDRFHCDPFFNRDKSDELYQRWIENCCIGTSDLVLVAVLNEEPVGYIACKLDGKKGIIDLIGVSGKVQRSGIGAALVNAMIKWLERTADLVEVGTQNRNIAAMRLYIISGFLPISSSITFHKWFRRE